MISSGNNTLNNPGDRKVIGNETPRYLYGINLGLNYKGFDLSAFCKEPVNAINGLPIH